VAPRCTSPALPQRLRRVKASWRAGGLSWWLGGPRGTRLDASATGGGSGLRNDEAVDADGDAVMLQAVEQCIDEGLFWNSSYQSGRSRLVVMMVETRL